MRSEIQLSVIIPTFRRPLLLRDLLASLERQICDVPFEVIVVANLPERGLRKTVQSFGRNFRFYETGRLNASIAKNKGLEKALGSIVLILEDDCYLQSRHVLQRHWEMHTRYPDAVAIGGRYSLKPGARKIERAYHWITDLRLTNARRDQNHAIDLPGGNCSFKRKLLGETLRFEESLPPRGSDTALFNNLVRHGYKILAFDDMVVEHRLQLNRMEFMRKAFAEGYTLARLEAAGQPPGTRHWNSFITFEQNQRQRGQRSDVRWTKWVTLHERVATFGRWIGRRQSAALDELPSLSWRNYALHLSWTQARRGVRSIFKRWFLVLDRSLALGRRSH